MCLLGEYYFEELARIPVVEYASEFRYRNPIINEGDIIVPLSQSGETADTLAAIKMAKEFNPFFFGVCNVVGSSIARETDSGVYIHAGPEIGGFHKSIYLPGNNSVNALSRFRL